MDVSAALLHGLVWSLLWGFAVTLTEIIWPQVFFHDYPKAIQEAVSLPPLRHKALTYTVVGVMMAGILSYIVWSGVETYRAREVSFLVLYLHAWIVAMCYNAFDLVVLDWGIFCTWRPKFIVLPGSEGHPAYRDYAYHFRGFFKGCVILTILALPLAGISYAALKLLVW